MPVFDFVDKPKEEKKRECTYTVFSSNRTRMKSIRS